jgi:hypothetical protein
MTTSHPISICYAGIPQDTTARPVPRREAKKIEKIRTNSTKRFDEENGRVQ